MIDLSNVAMSGMSPLLAEARRRARSIGEPVLASLTVEMPAGCQALSAFSRARSLGQRACFWSHPGEGSWMAGIGEATRIVTQGNGRFAAARDRQRALLESAVLGPRKAERPVRFVAGFRFDPGGAPGGRWGDFPDGLLVLPEVLLCREAGVTRCTLNAMIDAGADLEKRETRLRDLADAVSTPAGTPGLPHLLSLHVEDAAWRRAVTRAIRDIQDRRLEKVVVARTMDLFFDGPVAPEAVLSNLARDFPGCAVFAFSSGSSCFLGATPEELVSLSAGRVTSTCMAGSAKRGVDPIEDSVLARGLVQGDKERREHAVVADWVSSRLASLCRRVQQDETPVVAKLGNVQHLATRFRGMVDEGSHVLDLVAALHPTPAVGGFPLQPALELIRGMEPDRGWYSGPVGWTQGNEGEFGIAIRSALLTGNSALLYAGAGIVSGSDPEEEYEETQLKLGPLLGALGVAC